MAHADKIVYLGKGQAAQAPVVTMGKYGALARSCENLLVQKMEPLLHDMFAQVDDDLYRLAENSTSNSRQTLFFDSMRAMRIFKEKAEQAYLRMLQNTFTSFWEGRSSLGGSGSRENALLDDELSLVEKEELEEELAVTTMASRARTRFHEELALLDKRFAHMLGRKSLENDENPAGPKVLSEIFRVVLDEWETEEVLARIVVYKCFERVVLSEIGTVYQNMNQLLMEKGVLPELTPHQQAPRRAAASHVPAGQHADSQSEQGNQDASQSGVEEEEPTPSLKEIWQYIQQMAPQGTAAPAGNIHLPVLPRDNVMDALSSMQSAALSDLDLDNVEWSAVQERIRQQLSQTLCLDESGAEVHRIAEAEQQTIDIILMLFDHVLDDANLPDAMRALIARLQIPVLKAAIADPTFVDDKQHPARRLLNQLAAASVGWRDDGDRSEKGLYFHVKRAVDRIVHEYADDSALFDEVLQDFDRYMDKRARVKQILEDRLAQSISGEEKLEVAKKQVEDILHGLGVSTLPKPARQILEQPWKKLMTILLLREGEEGSNWRKAVHIAHMMVTYLGKNDSGFDREKLLSSIPEIISGLKKGFSYISFDQNKSTAMLNRLQACFIEALKNDGYVEQESSAEEPVVAEEEVQEPEIEDEHSIAVRNMKEGTWIKMKLDAEEEPLICKMVWRSQYTGTMVFVDGQGNKAAQMKEPELASYFRDGSAQFLEDAQAPLIDRAIKKMMKVLNARIVGPKLQLSE
ncbi:DUF1631 family protein [Thiolapillus brandeum]|uniref:DUF1631 domain-containing protein n=1 Tax=Thiolapillus brandeum TaxID=1076588 RepID=A0A7U6JHT9_9GAMM|nr:DUF1631 family protein [Thiolapillus brandeum]BAO44661.1 conserved hypothetical protein [Thiolapillus brandeum]